MIKARWESMVSDGIREEMRRVSRTDVNMAHVCHVLDLDHMAPADILAHAVLHMAREVEVYRKMCVDMHSRTIPSIIIEVKHK